MSCYLIAIRKAMTEMKNEIKTPSCKDVEKLECMVSVSGKIMHYKRISSDSLNKQTNKQNTKKEFPYDLAICIYFPKLKAGAYRNICICTLIAPLFLQPKVRSSTYVPP